MLGQAGKVPAISERDEAHRRPIRQEQEGAALRPVRQEQHETILQCHMATALHSDSHYKYECRQ